MAKMRGELCTLVQCFATPNGYQQNMAKTVWELCERVQKMPHSMLLPLLCPQGSAMCFTHVMPLRRHSMHFFIGFLFLMKVAALASG